MKINSTITSEYINSSSEKNINPINRITQNARTLSDTFERNCIKNNQDRKFVSFSSANSNTSAQIIDGLRQIPKKIFGKTKTLLANNNVSDTDTINRKSEVTKGLLDSLDNIPNNEEEKHDFILNILTTDFSSGNVLDKSEIGSGTYQNALKKTKELAQYSNFHLKTILSYIINITGISKSNTVPNLILERRCWDIGVYEKLKERGLYEVLKERRKNFPHEELRIYLIEYLGMITDTAYEDTIYMYEKMGKQKLDSDITSIGRLCASTNRETIDYILDNNLLNPKEVDIRNNIHDLLEDYYDIDLATLKLLHSKGLLKVIPDIGRCLSIKDSKYLVKNVKTDEEWKVIKDRKLLSMKLKGGSYLDAPTVCELMNLDDKIFEKITQREILNIIRKEQWKITKLATLTDEQWQTLINSGEDIDKIFNIDRFIQLSDKERKLAQNRGIHFTNYDDYELLRLNDDEWNNLLKRKLDATDEKKQPIYSSDAKVRLARLTDKEYQNAQERVLQDNYFNSQKSFTDLDEILARFDDEEYETFKRRRINDIDTYPEIKAKLTRMSDKQFKRITDDIIPFCEKCKEEDEFANYSANKTVKEYYSLAYLDDSNYELAKRFLETEYFDVKNKLSAAEIKRIVALDRKIAERIEKIINPENKIKCSTGACFTKEDVLAFCGYSIDELDKIAELSNYLTPSQVLDAKDNNLLDKICASKQFSKNKELIQKINCSKEFEARQKDTLTEYLLNLADTKYSKMSLKNKIYILDILNSANLSTELTQKEKDILRLDNHINAIRESLSHIIKPTEVPKEAVIKFMKTFFDSNNPAIDKTLSRAEFRQYGKEGLPLKYSRKEFISDLADLLQHYSKKKRGKIYKKLDIKAKEDSSGRIKKYNGIIDLAQLNQEGLEGEVYKIAHRFIKENQIETQNKELNDILNSLINAIPEYINLIGKHQDDKHSYSLDIHMLATLEEVLNNPKYETLSSKDKFILKFATVLHDIAKPEGKTDPGHPPVCARYVRDILNKESFNNMPKEYKDRIIEMVKNHHWLADYNLKNKNAKQIAAQFRRNGDLKIAQILTEADIKAIDSDNEYYNRFKSALEDSMQIPVEEAIDEIDSSGQVILTSKITDKSKIPQIEYKGKNYRVINFRQLEGSENLADYGFEPGTTVDNLRLIVHMVRKDKLHNMTGVHYLSDPNAQALLSGSYISLNNYRMYFRNIFGVSIEAENVNIANASAKNQTSGTGKGLSKFVEIISNNNPQNSFRDLIPNYIKEHLDLNNQEYIQLYKTIQNLKFKSQLDTPKYIDLGTKKISTTELKKVISEANDLLLNTGGSNNEVLLYCPKINAVVAQVSSLDEVPKKVLDFAQQYDFPIFLM